MQLNTAVDLRRMRRNGKVQTHVKSGIDTLSGRLLGSVPSDVSHRASCDVLILHTMKVGPRNPREQR